MPRSGGALVADRVGGEHRLGGRGRRDASSRACTSARSSPASDRVAALREAERRRRRGRSGPSFVRRPAPSSSAAMPTASAPTRVDDAVARRRHRDGAPARARSAAGVGVAALRPDPALVAPRAPLRPRRPPRPAGGPRRRRSRGRSSASRRAHASSTSSVKSRGPSPRTVSQRLADLERVADGAAERLVHVGEQARRPRGRRARPSSSICSASTRASSSVFMNAPSPTLTSSTIASAPAASFFDMIDAAISGTMSTVAVTSRSA